MSSPSKTNELAEQLKNNPSYQTALKGENTPSIAIMMAEETSGPTHVAVQRRSMPQITTKRATAKKTAVDKKTTTKKTNMKKTDTSMSKKVVPLHRRDDVFINDYSRRLQIMRARTSATYVMSTARHDGLIQCVKVENGFPVKTPELPAPERIPLRLRVISIDKICRYCMTRPAETVDHIWPLSIGGCNHLHNMVGACQDCNNVKRDSHPKEIGMKLHLPLRFFYPESNI